MSLTALFYDSMAELRTSLVGSGQVHQHGNTSRNWHKLFGSRSVHLHGTEKVEGMATYIKKIQNCTTLRQFPVPKKSPRFLPERALCMCNGMEGPRTSSRREPVVLPQEEEEEPGWRI